MSIYAARNTDGRLYVINRIPIQRCSGGSDDIVWTPETIDWAYGVEIDAGLLPTLLPGCACEIEIIVKAESEARNE